MSDLTHAKAILLGAIQGVTEFLPVSSSGHLVITQNLLDLDPSSPQMLLFDVATHFATLLAVVFVFRGEIKSFARRLARERSHLPLAKHFAHRVLALTLFAAFATAAIALPLKDKFESAVEHTWIVGTALLVTGVLLALLKIAGRGHTGWRAFPWWSAVLVGVAQAIAVLPGISRSGATICVARYLGVRREWAAQFSFLIAAPVIFGATLLKLLETLKLPAGALPSDVWSPVLTGSAVALVVGVLALKLLLGAIRRAKLHWFALYCWAIGAAVLLFL